MDKNEINRKLMNLMTDGVEAEVMEEDFYKRHITPQ
jgi:hypothetical protein